MVLLWGGLLGECLNNLGGTLVFSGIEMDTQ